MNALPIYYEAKLVANVSFDSHGFPELEYSESWQRSLPRFYPFGTSRDSCGFYPHEAPLMGIKERFVRANVYGTIPA